MEEEEGFLVNKTKRKTYKGKQNLTTNNQIVVEEGIFKILNNSYKTIQIYFAVKGEIFPGEYPYKCSYCEKRFKQVSVR